MALVLCVLVCNQGAIFHRKALVQSKSYGVGVAQLQCSCNMASRSLIGTKRSILVKSAARHTLREHVMARRPLLPTLASGRGALHHGHLASRRDTTASHCGQFRRSSGASGPPANLRISSGLSAPAAALRRPPGPTPGPRPLDQDRCCVPGAGPAARQESPSVRPVVARIPRSRIGCWTSSAAPGKATSSRIRSSSSPSGADWKPGLSSLGSCSSPWIGSLPPNASEGSI